MSALGDIFLALTHPIDGVRTPRPVTARGGQARLRKSLLSWTARYRRDTGPCRLEPGACLTNDAPAAALRCAVPAPRKPWVAFHGHSCDACVAPPQRHLFAILSLT